jgi:hypothetical protein
MRGVALLLFVLLAASVFLAGCGGKAGGANQVRLGDGSHLSLDLPPEQQPDPEDIRGAVSGVVVDDAIFPVPGAEVVVRGRDLRTTAGDDGRFAFEGMPPGLYTLEVGKEGHSTGLGTVNVKSGQVTKAVLQTPRLPFVDPYHTTWVFDQVRRLDEGLVWGTAGNDEHVIALDRPLATLVLESWWPDVQAPAGDPLDYSVGGERAGNVTDSGTGANPLLKTYGADDFARGEYAVRLRVAPRWDTLPAETRGRVFATLFYVDPAPDGWSFVGGDQ